MDLSEKLTELRKGRKPTQEQLDEGMKGGNMLQFSKNRRTYSIIAALSVLLVILFFLSTFSVSISGEDAFPSLQNANTIQIVKIDSDDVQSIYLKDPECRAFADALLESEYARHTASSNYGELPYYRVYVYEADKVYSSDDPPFTLFLSGTNDIYLSDHSFFCYKVLSDDMLSCFSNLFLALGDRVTVTPW